MPEQSFVAITSSMSLVRARADSLDSSPISTRRSPLPPSSLHTWRACSVPDCFSSDATTATPAGSLSKSTGLRFTYTSGILAAVTILVIFGVASVSTAFTMIASTFCAIMF